MNRITDKRLGFSFVLVGLIFLWLATFAMTEVFYSERFPKHGENLLKLKTAGLITLYFIMALAQEDVKDEVKDWFSKIWRIKHLVKQREQALAMITKEIDWAVKKWVKLFTKWDEQIQEKKESVAVRNGILTKDILRRRGLEIGKKIATGKITFWQFFWLCCYMVYAYLFATNVFNINQPIAWLIDLIVLASLNLTSNVDGLGEFLADVNNTLKTIKDEDAEQVLSILEQRIISLSFDLYLVHSALERVNREFPDPVIPNNPEWRLK